MSQKIASWELKEYKCNCDVKTAITFIESTLSEEKKKKEQILF